MQDELQRVQELAGSGLLLLGCLNNFTIMKMALNLLRSAREEKGYPQEYVAVKLGVSSSTISRWENGKGTPSFEETLQYADLLGLAREDILAALANRLPSKPTSIALIEVDVFSDDAYNRILNLIQDLGLKQATIKFTKRLR